MTSPTDPLPPVDADELLFAIQKVIQLVVREDWPRGLGPKYSSFESFARLQRFFRDHPLGDAICKRSWAFCQLVFVLAPKFFERWRKPMVEDPKAVLWHPALMEAAATAPIVNNGNFDEKEFFDIVEKLAQGKYAHSEW